MPSKRKQSRKKNQKKGKRPSQPPKTGSAFAYALMRKRSSRKLLMGEALARSIVNPWEYSACIPDGTMGVGCFSVKEVFDIATGAAPGGAGSIVFQLNPSNMRYVDSGSTVPTFSLANVNTYSSAAQLVSIKALYNRFRIVSGGLRATYVGSTMNDQGVCTVAQFPGNYLPQNLNGNNSAFAFSAAQFAETYPVKLGGQISWRPEDTEDFQFFPFDAGVSNLGTVQTTAAPWLFIGFTGCQVSSGIFRVELVLNCEGELVAQSFTPGGNPLQQNQMMKAEGGWYETAANVYRQVQPYAAGTAAIMQGFAGSSVAANVASKMLTAGLSNYLNPKMNANRANSIYQIDY